MTDAKCPIGIQADNKVSKILSVRFVFQHRTGGKIVGLPDNAELNTF